MNSIRRLPTRARFKREEQNPPRTNQPLFADGTSHSFTTQNCRGCAQPVATNPSERDTDRVVIGGERDGGDLRPVAPLGEEGREKRLEEDRREEDGEDVVDLTPRALFLRFRSRSRRGTGLSSSSSSSSRPRRRRRRVLFQLLLHLL